MSSIKIFHDPKSLVAHIDEQRRRGATIATACGCFELLHVGHIRYLYAAKALADLLIVAVNTDASMKLIKPKRKPAPDIERFEILAALEPVDYVVPLSDPRPDALLELFRPDVHCKGTDYKLEDIPERSIVENNGGRIALVGDPKDHSTTEILRKIKDGSA